MNRFKIALKKKPPKNRKSGVKGKKPKQNYLSEIDWTQIHEHIAMAPCRQLLSSFPGRITTDQIFFPSEKPITKNDVIFESWEEAFKSLKR